MLNVHVLVLYMCVPVLCFSLQTNSSSPGYDEVDNEVFPPATTAKPHNPEHNNNHAHPPHASANTQARAPADDFIAPATVAPSFAIAPAGASSAKAPEEKPVAYCPPDLESFDFADETLIRKDKKRAKGQSKGQGQRRDDLDRGFVS